MCLESSSPHVDRSRRAGVIQWQLDFIVSRRDVRVRRKRGRRQFRGYGLTRRSRRAAGGKNGPQ